MGIVCFVLEEHGEDKPNVMKGSPGTRTHGIGENSHLATLGCKTDWKCHFSWEAMFPAIGPFLWMQWRMGSMDERVCGVICTCYSNNYFYYIEPRMSGESADEL
jgi:hypothetical protein